jgi:hypothetical protein
VNTYAFKGRGTFRSGIKRPVCDDVQSADWNVTARYNEPYIKSFFEEERESTMMLMVDIILKISLELKNHHEIVYRNAAKWRFCNTKQR